MTTDPRCCSACAALYAWDRAVHYWRRAQADEYATRHLDAQDASDTAQDWQRAAAAADYGAPLDLCAVETPFSVAYGW